VHRGVKVSDVDPELKRAVVAVPAQKYYYFLYRGGGELLENLLKKKY